MTVTKISCPHCRAILTFSLPLSEGTAFQCPQCQRGFNVQVHVAPAALNGAHADGQRASSSALVRAQAPRSFAHAQGPAATPAPSALQQIEAVSRGLRIGLVLGGFLLILVLGGVLLAVCLSGERGAGSETVADAALQVDLFEPSIKPLIVNRPLIELSPEDNATVEEMVRKGVALLKKTQGPEGSWGTDEGTRENFVAFGGLTLLECGVPADDAAVQKAAAFARARCPRISRTYPAALFLLFFDRLNDPLDKERIHDLAMRLVAGQNEQGGWTYDVPLLGTADAGTLSSFLRGLGKGPIDTMRRAQPERLRTLPPHVRNLGLLQTPAGASAEFFRQGGDNSNTQFALLALWAARRHQLPVDHSLELVVRRFRNSQNPDGSFNYTGHTNASPQPSMTCAGLLGLAVGYGIANRSEGTAPQEDAAIQKALQHLSKSIGEPAANAKARIPMTEMYFLWSTERVAVLYQLKKIVDKDWYHWGYTMLRKNQRGDGSWSANRGPGSGTFPDTCFALLFLQRVNLAKDLTDKLNELMAAALPKS